MWIREVSLSSDKKIFPQLNERVKAYCESVRNQQNRTTTRVRDPSFQGDMSWKLSVAAGLVF